VLEIVGGFVRLVLAPPMVALELGEETSLTTTGFDETGSTENLTQRVIYSSSNPSVVLAENTGGNRSRIVAVGAGTATISAFDPVSGLSTSSTGDGTTVVVRDASLVRIVVTPTSARMALPSTRRFTAIGHREDGSTVNLTQRVEWISSDPAIATAPNPAGDRSRVVAVAPGTVTITAHDPGTGIRSTDSGEDATVTVGTLTAIGLAPAEVTLTVGQLFSLTTVGTFDDGGTINLTQDAVYASSDPGVVAALNTAGNRSQLEAIAPGVTTVTASRASSHPQATESNAVTITVLVGE
jgi:hypothetical protein